MRILTVIHPQTEAAPEQATLPVAPPAFEEQMVYLEQQIQKVQETVDAQLVQMRDALRKDLDAMRSAEPAAAQAPALPVIPEEWREKWSVQEASIETLRKDIQALADTMQALKMKQEIPMPIAQPVMEPIVPVVPEAVVPEAPVPESPMMAEPSLIARFWAYLNAPAISRKK